MPVSEWIGWQEFARLEPFGPWRDNLHAALICSLLGNIHRRKGSPKIRWQDFMLQDGDSAREAKQAQFAGWLKSVAKPKKKKKVK